MHLTEVVATTVQGGKPPKRAALAADGSSTVLRSTSIEVRFDRFLYPLSAVRQTICLQPLTDPVTRLADCRAGVFLEPAYDPVRRAVVYRQPEGTLLAPGTLYVLTVLAPRAPGLDGFRAFDGAPLAEARAIQMTTLVEDPPGFDEAAPTEDLFCEASACASACATSAATKACVDAQCKDVDGTIDPDCEKGCVDACAKRCPAGARLATCATANCHGPNPSELDPSHPTSLSMGLDLHSAEAIVRTAVGQVAHEAQTGEHADEPNVAPTRFGRAMPLIDPGSPGNSYLLYKLLVSPSYAASAAAPDAAEIERLRASVVVGMPMPPAGGEPVPLDALEVLSGWIASGADAHACP
jgi:hypothetical protein